MPETLNFDIAIVGAGPAGLAAANAAAENGANVVVIDENPVPGGQIWRGKGIKLHPSAQTWMDRPALANVRFLRSATVFDAPNPTTLIVDQGTGVVKVQAERVILATGARELFLPFPGWTLPGVAGAGGLQALWKAGLDLQGKSVVISGSGPLLLAVAANLSAAGANVRMIAEQTPFRNLLLFGKTLLRHPAKAKQALEMKGIAAKFRPGTWVARAEGEGKLQAVVVTNGWKETRIECDYLGCGFGLVPNVEIAQLLGCEIKDGAVVVDGEQRTTIENVFCVGEPTGVGGVDQAIDEGTIAGLVATGKDASELQGKMSHHREFEQAMTRAFAPRPELRALSTPQTLVCRCEDVTHERLRQCPDGRSAKLHTRCGMGPCQGRVCGPATEFLFGWEAGTVRPPLKPIAIQTLCEGWKDK